jgi:RNA polymerase sigma-70 factor (ECF subfamily)
MEDHNITKQSFENLFREYYSRLYYFAYDFTEDIEISKDIVSEVFTSIWNNKEHIENDKVVGYLFVSVRNQALNYIKRQKKNDDYVNFCSQVVDEEGDDDLELMDERITEMTSEIAKMPSRTKYILEECYFHHKKYKEVAEVLEISTDGVKKHIVKAMSILRNHFNVKKNKSKVPE